MKPAVIFLDVDGVLNSDAWYERRGPRGMRTNWEYNIDPEAIGHLNNLCELTEARIVVSSTWREGTPVRQLAADFWQVGARGHIIGATPVHRRDWRTRGGEIATWLAKHGWDRPYVILDDDGDMGALLPWLVQVDHRVGLTRRDVLRAVHVLRHQRGPHGADGG